MHQARFPLTDWPGNVQEVSRSILVQVTGILTEGFPAFLFSCIPVFTDGESQVCVSGRFLKLFRSRLHFLSY
jgi:hypothetical protein